MADYYSVLGVGRDAAPEEIKKAYRGLAKKYHPDSKSGTKDEERFKKINEAYQVLSDPKKKQTYDQFGDAAFSQTGGFGQGFGGGFTQTGRQGPFTYGYTSFGGEDVDFEDLFGGAFSALFGQRPGFGRRPRRGRDLRFGVTVDFADAVRGAEHEISFAGRKVKVKIPQGVRDGMELRFAGEGEQATGPQGERFPPGDLYLAIRIRPPKEFSLRGSDIYAEAKVSFVDAALGGTVTVPAVSLAAPSGVGEEKLKIPAGTQPGETFRLRGKGMPTLHGRGRGDAYIQVRVTVPKRLSRKERKVLEELRGKKP